MKNLQALVLLFIANTISGIAQGISMIAIPWYFAKDGEMTRFGLIYMFVNVVMLFWAPYTGVWVDRYNRKYLFLWLTLICGSLLALIAYLGFSLGGLHWFWVAAVFMITFLNYNVHYPNLYAFVQEISEPKYYGKVTSYIEIQGQLSAMLAGGGAALLLEGADGWDFMGQSIHFAAWEIHEIFAVDAATYFVALAIISMISYQPLVKREKEEVNMLQQLKVGYEYLKANKGIFIFGVASFSNFVATLLLNFFIAALYVNSQLKEGGDVYAASEIFYAIGAVFAGLAIRKIFAKMKTPQAVIILTLMGAGLFAVLAINTQVYIFYGMLFILGIANAGTRIMRITYLFQMIPNQVYGRANSFLFLTNVAFRILFLLLFSLAFFQKGNNVIYTCAIISLFLLLSAGVLMNFYRSFANPDEQMTQKLE